MLIQLFRYMFVGHMAWLVNMCSLYGFRKYAHIHYLFSGAVAAEHDVMVIKAPSIREGFVIKNT